MSTEAPTQYNLNEHTGILDSTFEQRVGLLTQIFHANPLGQEALKVLRKTKLRGSEQLTFEKPAGSNQYEVYPRKYAPIVDHQINAMIGSDGVSEIVGLEQPLRNLLVASLAMHDADKYGEILMLGLRAARGSETYAAGKKVATDIFLGFGVAQTEDEAGKLVEQIVNEPDVLDFHNSFDANIKIPLITRLTDEIDPDQLLEKHKSTIITLNSADSVGTMPILVARTLKFLDLYKVPEDQITEKLRHHAKILDASLTLPLVKGNDDDFMAVLTLYCDVLSSPAPQMRGRHALGLISKRIDDVVARGAYTELDEAFEKRFAVGYWTLSRVVHAGIERIIKQKGVEAGTLPPDINPEAIPIAIFDVLQKRINLYNKINK